MFGKAERSYQAELARWGASSMVDDELLTMCTGLGQLATCTAFESHIVRSLNKKDAAQKASVNKYAAIYATVPGASVQAVLWAAVQEALR
jgi:hypothetical protein